MSEDPPATISGFHAHVYYDAGTKENAARLRAAIEKNFDVRMGRWHDHPIGPHPRWSYQVAFAPDLFGAFIPWLALNRRGLVVFVHPETGDSIPDHTDHALWMGGTLDLNLDKLR